jgi:hypothetical protein
MFIRWLHVLVYFSALIYWLMLSFIMRPGLKTSYHPHFVIAFYLNCLPVEWTSQIPRSTRHDWLHKNQQEMFGFEWSNQNQLLLYIPTQRHYKTLPVAVVSFRSTGHYCDLSL